MRFKICDGGQGTDHSEGMQLTGGGPGSKGCFQAPHSTFPHVNVV